MTEEELTEPTPEPEVETEEVAPDPEAAIREREEAIAKREKELSRGFREIAEREKAIPQQRTEEAEPPVDKETDKVLSDWFQNRYGGYLATVENILVDTVDDEVVRAAEKSGIDPDELTTFITERRLQPSTMSVKAIRTMATDAAKLYKATTFDEAAREADIKAKVLAELAEQGVRIEGIKPAKTTPSSKPDTREMSAAERYEYLKSKDG